MILLSEETRKSRILERLEAMARNLVNASLVVLASKSDDVVRLDFSGQPAPLASFCAMMRSSAGGGRHCLTCRRLIVFSSHFRGLTEYTCHGGIQMVVAPVPGRVDDHAMPFVVASSVFANGARNEGWKAVRAHARDLNVNLKTLRDAYYALPVLTEERKAIMRSIVDVAAATIAEAACRLDCMDARDPQRDTAARPDLKITAELQGLLTSLRDASFESPEHTTGSALTDLIAAMVNRDPTLPFNVAGIARAARMTPNHFSALFHKNAGKTFVAFLTERRLERAKSLLLDVTLKVHEAAERAGFQDTAYFSRRFKQLIGQSPSQWRQRSQ